MNAILGGHIDLTDGNLTQKGKVDAGQLRFLAIATEKRSPELPNVPTFKELGYNVVYSVSRGLLAPKGTPADILTKLEGACAPGVQGSGFRRFDEKAGHGRALPRPQRVCANSSSRTTCSTRISRATSVC